MTDRYTLMCSKCKQLQEEWEPKEYDKVLSSENIWTIVYIDYSDYGRPCYHLECIDNNVRCVKTIDKEWIKKEVYKPALEQLIEMLGKISWRLRKVEVDVNRYSYVSFEAWTWKMPEDGLWAGTPQKALLKLVAYERWGLRYNEENETWEEG